MPNRLIANQLAAELATVNTLLATLPNEDVLGRISLQSRRDQIAAELARIGAQTETAASVALLFGGKPVVGAVGIEADFAAEAVARFQDLITNIWGAGGGEIGTRGPIPEQEQSRLHITSLLHGSVGFLLEEIGQEDRLFPSPLAQAADRAAEVIAAFAAEDENRFANVLEAVDQRVLNSAREFFRRIHRNGATLKLVEGEREFDLADDTLARAYNRAENVSIEETERDITGELLGVIPIAGRFELRMDDGTVVSGTVAPTLSESYLERIVSERLVGRRWRAHLRTKQVTRFGRPSETNTLLDIADIPPETSTGG